MQNHKTRKRGARSKRGMGTIELAITAIIGVTFSALAIDLGLMMLGNQNLDRATRDAARAAAGQSDTASAKQAAIAALGNHKADGTFVSTPQLVDAEFEYQDYDGTPMGQTIPKGGGAKAKASYVRVVASNQVLLPANLSIFKGFAGLKMKELASGKMTFRRAYYFPIVKQSLNAAFQ